MADRLPPHVLLDAMPGAAGLFDESFLERNGVRVSVCAGPQGSGHCPLVDGHGCKAFEEAQGVIFELNFDDPLHRAIVERYRALAPEGSPIRVVITPTQAERYRDELRDVEIWTDPPTAAELDGFVARVEAFSRSTS